MMRTKKVIAAALAATMLLGLIPANETAAAKKPKLSKANCTVSVGEKANVVLKGIKKALNVKWSLNKKNIVKITKKESSDVQSKVTFVAKKPGKVKIKASYKSDNKKNVLVCNIRVSGKTAAKEEATADIPATVDNAVLQQCGSPAIPASQSTLAPCCTYPGGVQPPQNTAAVGAKAIPVSCTAEPTEEPFFPKTEINATTSPRPFHTSAPSKDIPCPGRILVGESYSWNWLYEQTDGLDSVLVEPDTLITLDYYDGLLTAYYYIDYTGSMNLLSEQELSADDFGWTEYTGPFTLTGEKSVVYAKFVETDKLNPETYYASTGLLESSEDAVEINRENFPGDTFRSYVKGNFDVNHDNYLSKQEIENAAVIDMKDKYFYQFDVDSNIKGIELFTNIQSLKYCDGLGSFADISLFPHLKELDINGSDIGELDLSNNTELETLICIKCNIKNLNVSMCPNLKVLDCSDNEISEIDISSNKYLESLKCNNNTLTALDVRNSTLLEAIECSYNKIKELDVSKCADLEYFNCSLNKLKNLDVNANAKLFVFRCSNNLLSTLNVLKNAMLYEVNCSNNKLTSLSFGGVNANLQFIICENNELSTIDISGNEKLGYLDCRNNNIKKIELSSINNMHNLYYDNDTIVTGWNPQNSKNYPVSTPTASPLQ